MLSEETFRLYICQDFPFLEGFARAVAIALSKPSGFRSGRSAWPQHAVSGPRWAVRYSITLRMERQVETAASP